MPIDFSGPADSHLQIDLGAIVQNWRLMDQLSPPTVTTAAMVKGNAYGLGADRVGPALAAAGCTQFFVASLGEAMSLRQAFDDTGHAAPNIMVLHGVHRGQEDGFTAVRAVPVLNDLEQVSRWRLYAQRLGHSLTALIHFDTGMTRLGLDALQTDWLIQNRAALEGLDIAYVMSHLVSGEISGDLVNQAQLDKFREIRSWFAGIPASLANSAGAFLGEDYHFHMVRPGIALYGVHPAVTPAGGLQPTLGWTARILQMRHAAAGDKVGYNGTYELTRDSRIATLGVGYADGYRRQLGNKATVRIGRSVAPVIGRVSMDSITVDVTDLGPDDLRAETAALIHPAYGLHQMATDAGTIAYEILTQLGHRPERGYSHG